jgi:hypothetical protein
MLSCSESLVCERSDPTNAIHTCYTKVIYIFQI